MPKLTGDRLARGIKAIRPCVPVILCTGFSDRICPDRAEAQGIAAFLMKPLLPSDLARTVRRVLDANKASGGQPATDNGGFGPYGQHSEILAHR
jgi:FixJ family two-component response regulator